MVCQATTFVGTYARGRAVPDWSDEVKFAPVDYWQPAHSDATAVDGLASLVYAVVEASNAGQAIHALG